MLFKDMQRFGTIVTCEGALVWILHRAGTLAPTDWVNFPVWVRFTPLDQMVVAGARTLSLGLAYWLLVSSLLLGLGTVARLPALIRSVEWATLPVVRTSARRIVAFTMATATTAPVGFLITPTTLTSHASVIHEDDAATDPGDRGTSGVSLAPTGLIVPTGATVDAPRSVSGSVPTPRLAQLRFSPKEGTYEVRSGDSLWSIAEDVIDPVPPSGTTGEETTASYWVRLVDLNRDRLRSDNPDLIYPGEIVELPSLDG